MPNFKGSDYVEQRDSVRLATGLQRVRDVMLHFNRWMTAEEIADASHVRLDSAMRYVRYLKHPKFGGFIVEKRLCEGSPGGTWEYALFRSREATSDVDVPEITP